MDENLSVLVVDDDPSVSSSICLNLERSEYNTRAVNNGSEALKLLQSEAFDIVLCDLVMPEVDGLSFVEQLRHINPSASVVMMSGYGQNELALKAIRAGAVDYISKPFDFQQLLFTLRKLEEREKLKAEKADLHSSISQKYNFSNIIAHSQSMRDIFETVKRLANFNTTVLITGESGTGKELLARAIHNHSPRRGRAFVAINCGAIPESLVESELFGHKKGAFTDASRDKRGLFEEASGGTIFLDEIGELPLHLQVKLLRALQEQQIRRVGDEEPINIDVRVIAATLRDLEEDVELGRFRDDLYYRLNVVSVHIPPLRERTEEVAVLVQHFMKKHNKKLGLNIRNVSPEAMKCLMNYGWRGNVRELENCIERAMVLTESDGVDMESLPPHIRESSEHDQGNLFMQGFSDDNLSIKQRTRALETNLIARALKRTHGNRTHAAKILEISHRALLYKLKEYGFK